ncbi:uncharacterized protein mlphb [Pangasianodon hypophthalmus]|uniref:uncharacterized protein mlphb n=1 Tax=Pangasianodon hypophthalmus TaxID=310915 RepID=UPI002306E197|nr:uncharacterized protein mlphb [Pangasianodon hypophthalmus]
MVFFTAYQGHLQSTALASPVKAETVEDVLSLVDLEELELKQRLKKLTESISDKEKSSDENFTSDEDEANQLTDDLKPPGRKEPYFASALKREAVTPADGSFFRTELSSMQKSAVDIERPTVTQRRLSFYEVSTASCELSRLEDEVAIAVARVQSAQSASLEFTQDGVKTKLACLRRKLV